MSVGFRFERLSPVHDRSTFACEQPSLTDYLLKFAGQNERSDMAACFVALAPDTSPGLAAGTSPGLAPGSNRVAGYYTISAHAVLCDELSPDQRKGLPSYDRIPAWLIGRLARDLSMKGEGLGELLLIDAMARLCAIEAAARMIVVDPIDDNARAFYCRYGFAPLGRASVRLFLPMVVARKALR